MFTLDTFVLSARILLSEYLMGIEAMAFA